MKKQKFHIDNEFNDRDKKEIFNLIIILLGLVAFVILIYYLLHFSYNNKLKSVEKTEINTNLITASAMLSQKSSSYYIYIRENDSISKYLKELIDRKREQINIYEVDSKSGFNLNVLKKNKYNNNTLLYVENNRIIKAIQGYDKIEKELSN